MFNALKDNDDLLKLADKVYDDGFKEPIKSTSSLVNLLPRAIKAALTPVEQWILHKEHSINITQNLLEQKLTHIEPDEIVSPESYVAVPALNAIAYCYDSDELRNLYANLLARSMISTEKENVHPAFVEIIKQMSPLDANVLKTIYETPADRLPLLHVRWSNPEKKTYSIIQKNISWIETYDYEITSRAIENLLRQKLIEIIMEEKYSNESVYDIILKSQKFKNFLSELSMPADRPGEFEFAKTLIQQTAFGKLFYEICIKDL